MDKATYKRAFDTISAPDTIERIVLDRIAPRPHRAVPRLALILCAVLVLTCSVAVASGLTGGWLGAIINLNGNDVPEGNLQPINQTVEADGVRMTLHEAASDGVHIYLLVDIEALDGQNFSHEESEALPMSESIWVDGYLLLEDSGGYGMNVFRLDDGSDPARAQLAFRFDASKSRAGQQMELVISSLEHSVMVPHEDTMHRSSEPLVKGDWRFSFRLNAQLETVPYKLNTFDVSLSALGISIEGAGCGVLWPGHLADGSTFLKMTDGTLVELSSLGYHCIRHNNAVLDESIEAGTTRLIDPASVVALIISGVEYPLDPVQ